MEYKWALEYRAGGPANTIRHLFYSHESAVQSIIELQPTLWPGQFLTLERLDDGKHTVKDQDGTAT